MKPQIPAHLLTLTVAKFVDRKTQNYISNINSCLVWFRLHLLVSFTYRERCITLSFFLLEPLLTKHIVINRIRRYQSDRRKSLSLKTDKTVANKMKGKTNKHTLH